VADTFQSRSPLLALGYARNDDGVMKYNSAPQVHLSESRRMQILSGKLLGGTSRINNALYSRCQPGEFDDWGEGWAYHDDIRPLFDRSERNAADKGSNGEWSTRTVEPFFPATQVY
jgi:choline dehydrogenase-like flavoprotein